MSLRNQFADGSGDEFADDKYILDENRNIRRARNLLEWAEWFEKTIKFNDDGTSNRHVALTKFDVEGISVSTVFLGVDHNWLNEGPPILFETMIFGGPMNDFQRRYCTWEEAERGHERTVKAVKAVLYRRSTLNFS